MLKRKKLLFLYVLDIIISFYEGVMFNCIKSLFGNGDSKMGRMNIWLKDWWMNVVLMNGGCYWLKEEWKFLGNSSVYLLRI